MREILFRGKRTDNCEWAYGAPTKDNHGEMVMVKSTFEWDEYNCRGANCLYVDENTVGQYTGLTDKNGKKIFEGDILRRTLKGYYLDISYIFKIVFVPVKAVFAAVDIGGGSVNFISDYINNKYEIDVIGNIHDNPELLGGEGNG